MKTIQVNASKKYDICIGKNILGELGTRIRTLLGTHTRIAIVTDDTVNALHGTALEQALCGIDCIKFVFPAGEASKTVSTRSEEHTSELQSQR